MVSSYKIASNLIAPFLPLWLEFRRWRGKEDRTRGHERLGHASLERPRGTLLWIHAASVGEANSVLLFIEHVKTQYPRLGVLLTTGTVSSARLMLTRLPKGVLHQYVPVDTPAATERFMSHWRPDIALWVESEFWPNLIEAADRWQCYMGIINGRMSERSFKGWNKRSRMIHVMMQAFDVAYAQGTADGKRLAALGAYPVKYLGNLKYDAGPLDYAENSLKQCKEDTNGRLLLLAASTHPGEEALLEKTHMLLSATHKNLLTIIVPRHPGRGQEIAKKLGKNHTVALRSEKKPIEPEIDFYIADTLGELGLFYRLCDAVFMGGSLVPHGGQNPLEPARLSCAILTGPHTHNFTDIYKQLKAAGGCLRVKNAEDLAAQLSLIFSSNEKKGALQNTAKEWVDSKSGTARKLLHALAPAFNIRSRTS